VISWSETDRSGSHNIISLKNPQIFLDFAERFFCSHSKARVFGLEGQFRDNRVEASIIMDVSNSIEIAKPLKDVWKILAGDFDKAYTFIRTVEAQEPLKDGDVVIPQNG
jgi:hypothetical protein